jgi:hypothetical protein
LGGDGDVSPAAATAMTKASEMKVPTAFRSMNKSSFADLKVR